MPNLYAGKEPAARYDTARALPEETFRLWRDAVRREVPPDEVRRVLDLGGGTGRFAGMLQEAFRCPVTVVDPSAEMLAKGAALGLPGVDFIPGAAEHLPLADGAFDLAWLSNVFHHLEDSGAAFREVRRVLRDGGYLVVRNGTQESDREMVWKRCFPEVETFDAGRIPERETIETAVTGQGFTLTKRRLIYQRFAASAQEYYDKISARGLSALIGIPDAAFAAGVKRLRRWADAQPPGEVIDEPVDVWFFRKAR